MADPVYHSIIARNMLVGESNFLSLALPPTWQLSRGAGHPEITANHERNGQRWVASGDAWYVLHEPERRWALEVRLIVRPVSRTAQPVLERHVTVAGHPARVNWTRRRRGLFKRWSVTYVTVKFFCPHTERQITLEFSGRAPDEAFQEMIEVVRHTRCH